MKFAYDTYYETLPYHADIRKNDYVKGDFIRNCTETLVRSELPASRALAISNCLYERMNDQDLFYHSPFHILTMFQWAEKHRITLTIYEALGIWFHDAIYIRGSEKSEKLSVQFMESLLSDINPHWLSAASGHIMATAHHMDENYDNESGFTVMDLDMSSFSWPYLSYVANAELIRKELEPLYGLHEYREGRMVFLRKLMARPRIFRTNFFRDRFEATARYNIETHLKQWMEIEPA